MEPEKSLLKEFVNGGWVIPVIGAATMITRLLSSPLELSLKDQFKKISAAAILSGVAWVIIDSGFILSANTLSSFYKAIIYGIIGVISPEIINGVIKIGIRFERNAANFFKKY